MSILVGEHTRLIVQGMGREGTFHAPNISPDPSPPCSRTIGGPWPPSSTDVDTPASSSWRRARSGSP